MGTVRKAGWLPWQTPWEAGALLGSNGGAAFNLPNQERNDPLHF